MNNTLTKIEKLIVEISKKDNLSIATMEISPKGFTKEEIYALREWGVNFKKNPKVYKKRPDFKPKTRLDFCYENMPILQHNIKKLSKSIFKNKRILIHMIMETKTGALIKGLKKMGAEVFIHSFSAYTDNEIVGELKKEGFQIFADENATEKEDVQNAVLAFKTAKPDYIIDDGAHLTEILLEYFPKEIKKVKGICEETTSGVDFFKSLKSKNKLPTKVVLVNDSKIKTDFDNVHGTTETVIAMMLRLTKKTFKNKNVVVQGYGPVGKGCALRARALGANVYVSEINPLKALNAVYDGFYVRKIEESVKTADFIITASGYKKALNKNVLKKVKNEAIIASAGGTYDEIDYRPLVKEKIAVYDDTNKDVCILKFKNKKLFVLSNGLGANYTSGEGNPIEIMDLSFAAQVNGLVFLIRNEKKNLKIDLYNLDDSESEHVAKLKLDSLNINIDC